MKIIALRLKNLHSLKGEFEIDFTQPVLSGAGIFAITGPTGAGKSTLLDAITLALYGYTPRLGEISRADIDTKKILVTHGTNEAYAELVFEVNQKKYLANWSINKNRNKNWNDYKHALSEYGPGGNWNIITDKRSDVKAAITTIIGLNKEQFSKAIVLSQGKFDEFLTAPATDRYKILEIITGTGLYREIGKRVYEKFKEARDAYILQQSKISQIAVLSEDELRSLSEGLTQYTKQIEKIDDEVGIITLQRDKRNELIEIKKGITKCEEDLEKIKLEASALAPNLLKLKNYEKAIRIEPLYAKWLHASQTATDQINKIEVSKANIQNFHELREGYLNNLSNILKKSIPQEDFPSELEALIASVNDIDKAIGALKPTLESNKNNNRALIDTLPDNYKQAVIQNLSNSPQALEAWIEEQKGINQFPLPGDVNPITYLTTLINQQEASIESLKELRYPAENLPHLQAKNEALLKEQQESESTKKNLIEADGNLHKILQQDELELSHLQAEWKRLREMNQLASIRNSLIAGEPCPCCGSTEHPYTTSMPDISSMVETQVAEKEKAFAENKDKKASIERELYAIKISVENSAREINNNNESIQKLVAQTKSVLEKVGLVKIPSSINLNFEIDQKSNELISAKSALLFTEKESVLMDIVAGAKLYLENQALLRKKEEALTLILNGTTLDFLQNTLQNGWIINETNWANANDIYNKLVEEQKVIQLQKNTAINKLLEAQLAAGFESMESFQAALVSEKEAEAWKTQQSDLERKQIATNADKNTLLAQQQTTIAHINPAYDDIDLSEKLRELDGQKSSIQESRGRILQQLQDNDTAKKNQEQLIAELDQLRARNELLLTMNNLIGDSNGDAFNKIVQRITLKQLLALANARMEKLMPRYRLMMIENMEKKEDQIWVVDLFMGSEARSINSVSGGERFIISLALALALSDLASQNVRIDSLFIDEGFGSLSPDELNNSIQMLERMQLEGNKMLGIISHVESLKERITTQLQIDKTTAGESTLYLTTPETRISLRLTN